MTASVAVARTGRAQRSSRFARWRGRRARRAESPRRGASDLPPLSPRLQLIRGALVVVSVLSFTLLLQLFVVSSLQHASSQEQAFDRLRSDLAAGTAPVGPTDVDGVQLAIGTPVAYLEIPAIDVKEVVGEGTTPGALFLGPGHRRDTPLPGQIGASVVMGRSSSFGGPFSRLGELEAGDRITVTTGQGVFEYRVTAVRVAGDPIPPPPAAGSSRLLLATADGSSFLPSGVLRVDADLEGTAVVGAPRLLTADQLPGPERFMSGDTSTLWALALWIQALILLTVGLIWAWHRWGRAQAWIVFSPPLLLVGLSASGEVARLLPNMS